MRNKFRKIPKTPRRLWAWDKRTQEQKPKAKLFVTFFKRKLPPAHRS